MTNETQTASERVPAWARQHDHRLWYSLTLASSKAEWGRAPLSTAERRLALEDACSYFQRATRNGKGEWSCTAKGHGVGLKVGRGGTLEAAFLAAVTASKPDDLGL